MSINMRRYVDIASAVAGAGGVAQQKLVGRIFTPNEMVPPGVVLSVGPGGAEEYFGGDAEHGVTDFARQYFSHMTPAPASKAKELQICRWVDTPSASWLFGAPNSPVGLAQLKEITAGTLDITIDGIQYNLTGINLGGVADIDAAMGIINSAIATAAGAGTKAEIKYGTHAPGMYVASTLKHGTQGAFSIDGGTIGVLLGLDEPYIESPGSDAQTPLEAFRLAEDVSDSFGTCCFQNYFGSIDDAVAVSEYVAGQNVKYEIIWGIPDDGVWSERLRGTASTSLVLNKKPNEYKESLPMALKAATDYTRRNAAINYMFRTPGVTWTPDVTTDAEADQLDAAKVNYYGETATAGQKIAFFQRGIMCGPVTAPQTMTVHANEQWFKAKIKADLMGLFLAVGILKANTDGKAAVLLALQDSIDAALFNGVIIRSKNITPTQQIAIRDMTGDEDAWRDVQLNGYWVDAAIVEETGESGVTEYICKYTVIYSKGDAINKIEGSHNLI